VDADRNLDWRSSCERRVILIGRSISKALSAMVRAMIRLAGGDLQSQIPSLGRKDEVGEMAGAVEVFKPT